MKLTYFQLEPHLTKKLHPIYIVSGDELFLKQEATRLIRKAAKQANYLERVTFDGSDWEALYPLLNASSLLAEKRIIELDFSNALPNKVGNTILQEYANHPSADVLLLITTNKVDAKITKSAWFQALTDKSIHVTIWPISQEQLPQWIMQRGKKYKLMINFQTAQVLAEYVEGNLIAAAQSLEKLYLLQPDVIDASLIHQLITDESHFSVYDLTESLLTQDKKRMLHILTTLKTEGTEPILILWAITRELRLVADIIMSTQAGMSFEMAFQKYKVFAKRQNQMRRYVAKQSIPELQHLLSFASEIDQIAKGAKPGNPWHLLELLCLRS